MDANENEFALEVHEEMFNEEYSITHEENSFDQSTDGAILDENHKPHSESKAFKKNEVKNNHKDAREKDLKYSRSSNSSSGKNNGETDYIDISRKKDSKLSEDKKIKISPIKWLSYSPSPDIKRQSYSLSHHDHKKRSQKSLSQHKSNKNHDRRLQRSGSFELHQHLKYIFASCQYFLIKSNNKVNVDIAKKLNVWSTPPGNEAKINHAFDISGNVILIFSIKESGHFQGFARVAKKSDHNHPPINWVLPVGLSMKTLEGIFALDWISKQNLPFGQTTHILNSYNENQQIKIGRDGQEIDPKSGESLCRLFYFDEKIDIEEISKKSIFALKQRNIYFENENASYKPSKTYNRYSKSIDHNHPNKHDLLNNSNRIYYYDTPYPSAHSFHQEIKTPSKKYYEISSHARDFHRKAHIPYLSSETSFGPRSADYKKSSPYMRKTYSKAISPKRDVYKMLHSPHERVTSPYNIESPYESYNSNYSNYKKYSLPYIKTKSTNIHLISREDSYSKISRSQIKYHESSRELYNSKNGIMNKYVEPLKLEKNYDRVEYSEKHHGPLKIDKQSTEKSKILNKRIDKNVYHEKYEEAYKEKYSDKMNRDKTEENRKNDIVSENHNLSMKTTKRKSYSSEHKIRKKLRSITPENKKSDRDFLSAIQSRTQNAYNIENKQYVFDPRVPPPPPFPFFPPAYLPLQSHLSYHTHSDKKEKKSKSKHEKKH